MKPEDKNLAANRRSAEPAMEATATPNLNDPAVVLSFLETDQVVAAKRQMRFGRRKLSVGTRVMLWALRVYVVAMLVLVVISVVRTLYGTP